MKKNLLNSCYDNPMTFINGEEFEIQTRHLRIAAKRWGDPAGIPVLAIHGFFDNAASFDLLAPILSDVHFVAIDLPGHGFSEHKPQGVFYHSFDYVADVIAITKELNWKSFALLGHSMGAAIAMLVAGAFPEQVSHLVLLEGIDIPLFGEADKLPHNLRESIQRLKIMQVNQKLVYKSWEEIIEIRCKSGELRQEYVERLAVRGITKLDEGYIWHNDPRTTIKFPFTLSNEQLNVFLQAILAPCLLIVGDRSFMSRRSLLEFRCSFINDFKRIDLSGGHYLQFECPEQVAAEISDFLI